MFRVLGLIFPLITGLLKKNQGAAILGVISLVGCIFVWWDTRESTQAVASNLNIASRRISGLELKQATATVEIGSLKRYIEDMRTVVYRIDKRVYELVKDKDGTK